MILVANLSFREALYLPLIIAQLKRMDLRPYMISFADELEHVPKQQIAGIVLSGSDLFVRDLDNPVHQRVKDLLKAIMDLPASIPRMGICFGAQFLYHFAGGNLVRLPRAICSYRNIDSTLPVQHAKFCLHEVLADPMPTVLEPIAWATMGNRRRVCAFRFKNKPWFGFLFHPEADRTTRSLLQIPFS